MSAFPGSFLPMRCLRKCFATAVFSRVVHGFLVPGGTSECVNKRLSILQERRPSFIFYDHACSFPQKNTSGHSVHRKISPTPQNLDLTIFYVYFPTRHILLSQLLSYAIIIVNLPDILLTTIPSLCPYFYGYSRLPECFKLHVPSLEIWTSCLHLSKIGGGGIPLAPSLFSLGLSPKQPPPWFHCHC